LTSIRLQRQPPPNPHGISDAEIPVFRDRASGEIDMLTLVRLLPAYLRLQQAKQQKAVMGDYTFQPTVARRLCLVLRMMLNASPDAPQWLLKALHRVKPQPFLWDDADDNNVSPYWLRILRFLDAVGEVPRDIADKVAARLRATAVRWFLFKLPESHVLEYTEAVYPNALPFVDTDDTAAYLVTTDPTTGAYTNLATGVPLVPITVLTDPAEIARAYSANLGAKCAGGYVVRPTYLTEGKVTLYNAQGPTAFDLLRQQLVQLRPALSETQIQAHLHTARAQNLWVEVPWFRRQAASTLEAIAAIRKTGRAAKPVIEPKQVTVFRADMAQRLASHPDPIISSMVRAALAYQNADHSRWKEVDFILHHAPPPQSPSSASPSAAPSSALGSAAALLAGGAVLLSTVGGTSAAGAPIVFATKDTKTDTKSGSSGAPAIVAPAAALGSGAPAMVSSGRQFAAGSGAAALFETQAAALSASVANDLAAERPLHLGAFDPNAVFDLPKPVPISAGASAGGPALAKPPNPKAAPATPKPPLDGKDHKSADAKAPPAAVPAADGKDQGDADLDEMFSCPVGCMPMVHPTITQPCGHTFERSVIEDIKARGMACPLCGGEIRGLATNFLARDLLRSRGPSQRPPDAKL
jgi:hypothetical protein